MDNNINNLAMTIQAYRTVRQQTVDICAPLELEDYVVQGMTDVSPAKWHLAHTTWFFETMILMPHLKNYRVYHPLYHELFNSYYQTLGQPYPRPQRGLLSRPTVKMIYGYRQYVDEHLETLLQQLSPEAFNLLHPTIILGLHHEQQHQELLLMDIKFNYSLNLDYPCYHPNSEVSTPQPIAEHFIAMDEGLVNIGYNGSGFCYDNEQPCHCYFVQAYALANRLVTNAEYLAFVENSGYQAVALWLDEGWEWKLQHQINAPLYWKKQDNQWFQFTLRGLEPLNFAEPVIHLSFYEADAYARWRGKRLPTEIEWENFVHIHQPTISGNFLENLNFHPLPANNNTQSQQLFGDAWEWTTSAYSPYPGYQAYSGSLSEYNSKFMCNQMVLRGGCCVTPKAHIRATYRNFYHPAKRWPFTGLRLAEPL